MNVLFITSDHHQNQFLGFNGNPISSTPNLDKLASQGTYFKNCYCASPLCVPARAALFSGKYIHETGNWDNAHPWDGKQGGAEYLRENGIYTVATGKLDHKPDVDHGFNEEIEIKHRNSLDIFSLYRKKQANVTRFAHLGSLLSARGRKDYPGSHDENTLQASIDWLRNKRPNNPWFLNVNFIKPHPVWAPPTEIFDRFDKLVKAEDLHSKYLFFQNEIPIHEVHPYLQSFIDYQGAKYASIEQIRKAHVGFHSFCYMVDSYIGELLNTIDDENLSNETVVIYTSDHGNNVFAHGCWTLGNSYEDSLSVPLIIKHPNGLKNATNNDLIHHFDIFPTIAEAFELQKPHWFRGESLLKTVLNGTPSNREFIMSEIHSNGWPNGAFAIRNKKHKYVYCVNEKPMFYDLEADPHEMNDLYISDPSTATKLSGPFKKALFNICDPEEVNRKAFADQEKLRLNLKNSGKLASELSKRGFEENTEELIHKETLLKEINNGTHPYCESMKGQITL